MFRKLSIFVATALAAVQQVATIDTWIAQKKYPKRLSQTMMLATDTATLLNSAGSRNIALFLPTNTAWQSHSDIYTTIKQEPRLGVSLLLDASVEVPGPITSVNDLVNSGELYTMAGTPIVVDKKDRTKFYFGETTSDGSIVPVGEPIKVTSKPVAVFDNIFIFEATSFSMPPSLATPVQRYMYLTAAF